MVVFEDVKEVIEVKVASVYKEVKVGKGFIEVKILKVFEKLK